MNRWFNLRFICASFSTRLRFIFARFSLALRSIKLVCRLNFREPTRPLCVWMSFLRHVNVAFRSIVVSQRARQHPFAAPSKADSIPPGLPLKMAQ